MSKMKKTYIKKKLSENEESPMAENLTSNFLSGLRVDIRTSVDGDHPLFVVLGCRESFEDTTAEEKPKQIELEGKYMTRHVLLDSKHYKHNTVKLELPTTPYPI